MAGLKIGELPRRSGTTVKTIRFYEAQGLLPRPVRSPSGYRLYVSREDESRKEDGPQRALRLHGEVIPGDRIVLSR